MNAYPETLGSTVRDYYRYIGHIDIMQSFLKIFGNYEINFNDVLNMEIMQNISNNIRSYCIKYFNTTKIYSGEDDFFITIKKKISLQDVEHVYDILGQE